MARSDDPACYEEGKVQYDRLAAKDGYKTSVDRLVNGARDHRIALMCSEKEPLDCHRTILVAQSLVEKGVSVVNILADGTLESQDQTLVRLMDRQKTGPIEQAQPDAVGKAVKKRAQEIAYTMS